MVNDIQASKNILNILLSGTTCKDITESILFVQETLSKFNKSLEAQVDNRCLCIFIGSDDVKCRYCDPQNYFDFLQSSLDAAENDVKRLRLSRWQHKHKAKRWWQLFRKRGRIIETMQKKKCNA